MGQLVIHAFPCSLEAIVGVSCAYINNPHILAFRSGQCVLVHFVY